MTKDPYRFLEDIHHPDCVSWCDEQARRFAAWAAAHPCRRTLIQQANSLINRNRYGVPTVRAGRLFFTWQRVNEAFPVLAACDEGGPHRILVDPAKFGGQPHRIGAFAPDRSGQRVAVQLCPNGVSTGPVMLHHLDQGISVDLDIGHVRSPTFAWADDGLFIGQPDGLWYLPIGSGQARRVWCPPGSAAMAFVAPIASPGARWLAIVVRNGADPRNGLWLARLDGSERGLRAEPVLKPEVAVATPRFRDDDTLAIATTLGASRGRVVLASPAAAGPTHWRDALPESSAVVRGLAVASGNLLVTRVVGGLTDVVLVPPDGSPTTLPLALNGGVSAITGHPSRPLAWADYADPGTPPTVLAIDFACADAPATTPWPSAREEYGDHAQLSWERLTCPVEDGPVAEVSLIRRLDAPHGPAATILAAYGGFGRVQSMRFRPEAAMWLKRGGTYAIAHLRGDGDHGAEYHSAGRGRNKLRTISDLITVATQLIAEKLTAPEKLGLLGFSAGGMLVSAAAIRRPDLFRACVPVNPVADLIRFPCLGIGKNWVGEFGDPEDPDDRAALLAYSPYHAVQPGIRYPAFLVCVNNSDDLVPPAHGRKLAAVLDDASGLAVDPPQVLLRQDSSGGHTWLPQCALVESIADVVAFFADRLIN